MQDNSFYNRAKELLDESDNINYPINKTLVEEFNMPSDKVSRWFKSLFGITIREALKQKFTPTRQQIEDALMLSTSVGEMQSMLGMKSTSAAWKGLLDREFGYSTYASAKANFIISKKVEAYNPCRDDNISILVSQFLGDGGFDEVRRSIRIVHGIKQWDYLKFKVGLINKAYPQSYPLSNIRKLTHTQGHEYVSWYSGNFGESTFRKITSMTDEELVSNLTPLGWCLWFLDDGNFNYCESSGKHMYRLSITISNEKLRKAAIHELNSVGFTPNESHCELYFSDRVQVAKFINTFVRPFDNIIPTCMKYKYDMKI